VLVGAAGGAAALATLGHSGTAAARPAAPAQVAFDFETGNFMDFVQPVDPIAPNPRGDVIAPFDVTLFNWVGHLTPLAWFDALAPYHPTAVGVYTRIPRRPSSESTTNRNMNIALIYAVQQVVKGAVPEQAPIIRQMIAGLGLNPDDASEDPTSPIGIGNLAGKGAIAARRRDGMNMVGDVGRRYNPRPYADYTGYRPVNTAYELINPSRWQPQLGTHRRRLGPGQGDKGIFTVQSFVTPQIRLVKPYSFKHPGQFRLAPPEFSDHTRARDYKRSVDEVLAVSAALTDRQKVTAEVFHNKILGLIHSAVVKARQHPELGIHGWAQFQLTHLVASLDVDIACWHHKAVYDAVRPITAIRHVYGRRPVTAWGGPGVGTVNDIPANEWASYLGTGDHPEYPSGSATTCAAVAQATRRFFDDDVLNWRFTVPAGWTQVEPGITPANDFDFHLATWTDYVKACADSRVWGGVHFTKTQERSIPFGEQVGDLAYEFVRRHIDGNVRD
jgi:hypothetical protein